ncbi:MAG: hypothetical protein HY517_01590 [Candidatus Aenigmarchaeota archaeon]|nr:hypothetical protein [Candidatus Aenigmarchaeota archaeon]
MPTITAAGREYRFNPAGLCEEEQEYVRDIAEETIDEAARLCKGFVERCHFFSESGFDFLSRAVLGRGMRNPSILGDDENCFYQHYWLAFDVPAGLVYVDPVGSYIGLGRHAKDILDLTNERDCIIHDFYSRGKIRVVTPHVQRSKGGVKLNTMSI